MTRSVNPATKWPTNDGERNGMAGRAPGTRRKVPASVLVAGATTTCLLLGGCITLKAPDKPIVIELNINIKQEVVNRLAGDASQTIDKNKTQETRTIVTGHKHVRGRSQQTMRMRMQSRYYAVPSAEQFVQGWNHQPPTTRSSRLHLTNLNQNLHHHRHRRLPREDQKHIFYQVDPEF